MPTLFEDIDARITRELAGRCILGVIVCARVDDSQEGILYLNANKKTDAGAKAVLNKDDLFLIASQSKTFTAVAALSLVERGLLNLDGTLNDLLPDLKQHPDHSKLTSITIKDLLQYRAPLEWQEALYDDWDMGMPYPTVADISGPKLLNMLNTHRLEGKTRQPIYSNTSYALLGAVIEKIARENKLGSSFADFVQKNLLEPNGLDKIYPGLSAEEIGQAKNIVQGYHLMRDGSLDCSLKPSFLACTPSGGFYGSAEQVSKFYHMLLSGKFLTDTSLDMMKEFSKIFSKGMGLHRYDDGSFGHGGILTGYESRTVYKDGVTISIMSNLCTLSNDHKPTPLDIEKPLFPRIITIVREAMSEHYPEQKWAVQSSRPGNRVVEGQKPAAG